MNVLIGGGYRERKGWDGGVGGYNSYFIIEWIAHMFAPSPSSPATAITSCLLVVVAVGAYAVVHSISGDIALLPCSPLPSSNFLVVPVDYRRCGLLQ